jgi:UDP-N-acetylmuramyl pentapeptide synthase
MIPLGLDEVETLAPGRLERARGAERVTGVTIDSRQIEPGDLFVAVGGGIEFVQDALASGAAAALVPEDAFGALGGLGQAVRERPSRAHGRCRG